MPLLTAALALASFTQLFDPISPITKRVEEVSRTLPGDFDGDGLQDLVILPR